MTSISLAAFLATILLLYLSTFILCAIIRITTGVSIQRIGYFSLRRVAYAPRDGLHLAVRGLSVSLHRPSFAQPTYITLRLDELTVTVDPASLGGGGGPGGSVQQGQQKDGSQDIPSTEEATPSHQPPPPEKVDAGAAADADANRTTDTPSHEPQSRTWRKLTDLKQNLKHLHKQVHWLTLVDIVATNTTLQITNSGGVRVGAFSLSVDTRRKTIEQGKLFRHKKEASSNQQPAEWICNVRNIVLAVDDRDPVEVLDNLGLNVHGLLHQDVDGLRDVSVSVKTGKLHVPYDDLVIMQQRFRESRQLHARSDDTYRRKDAGVSFSAFVEELDSPGSREESSIVQTVADSREFLSSILRGIQEIQIGISFFRASRTIQNPINVQKPVFLNVVTHELGIDLNKMDPSLPAHRMYFQRDDVAHQALLAAISLSVSIGDSAEEHGKVLYIPMATTTIRTTLPSKTVTYAESRDADERNTNVLFANLVATSPSVDLEPRQLSHLLSILRLKRSPRRKRRNNHLLISRLLPKASIKLSVHEPVLRFVLPIVNEDGGHHDYNMLVSSISSLSLDIESSHGAVSGPQYSLSSVFRVSSHQLYYQAATGVKQRLLTTEMMEVKAHLHATDEVRVVGTGHLNTFSLHLVSGDVTRGVHHVVDQFYSHVQPTKLSTSRGSQRYSLLRRLPSWLLEFQFECSGFSLEIAGVDQSVGNTTRGMVLQLQGWTADYQAQRPEPRQRYLKRRTPSHSTTADDATFRFPSSSPSRKSYEGTTDGRRLAVHGRGAEGFIIESAAYMEPETFVSVPRFEVAFSTSSDLQGPVFHVSSVIREIHLKYSLYRYYAIGVAVCALQAAFSHPSSSSSSSQKSHYPEESSSATSGSSAGKPELVTVDVKTHLVEVKCTMPVDPPVLLQMYGLATGCHRWSAPFMRCQLVRLHGGAPKLKGAWARIVSITNLRLGMRENAQKPAQTLEEAKGVDISTDFIRLAVPHHMVMHHVLDNFVNSAKAIKQLHHRFGTKREEYVLGKQPAKPKEVPRISLRSKALLFELEDDAFEWKLSNIYRLGRLEQAQRLAREEAHTMKTKKVDDDSRRRNVHLRPHGHTKRPSSGERHLRPPSNDRQPRGHSRDRSRSRSPFASSSRTARRSRLFRYNMEKAPDFLGSHMSSQADSWEQMQLTNARSWKSRMKNAVRSQNMALKEMRRLAGAEQIPEAFESDENILSIPDRPGLLAMLINDVQLVIDKPSFPLEEYANFLHDVGKGMPMDMKYSLLVPMSLRLEMGEARIHLRDFPLELLHIPPLRPGQPPKLPSWSISSDFVIAEEFRDAESLKHVVVNVVPPTTGADGTFYPGFSIDVNKTMSPVKTYSNPRIEINTSLPTSFSWGMSYHPVIQDVMKIFEGFTKRQLDPSEPVGFWDKIRLSFHSRISVVWTGDGDVQLKLKGSRDPYVVTGFGAGFVMVWRKDVQWDIRTSDDPKEFMTVTSGEYVLAIPDYSHHARHSYGSEGSDTSGGASRASPRDAAMFKKVVMKLSGNVRWLAGLVYERSTNGSGRSFDFKPHYDVVLKNPRFIDREQRPNYDAYGGFRSNHIHMSVAVVAPVTRIWSYSNLRPSTSYNTVHLTPRFFTHFFNWWSLFSGVMSLPIRQGALWPGLTKSSKKFSRHLGTVKYNLFLSPLFASHIYKHKDAEDKKENAVIATGLKVRLDSLMLDLHQRRELVIPVVRGRSRQTKASVMKIHRAHLDFISADCRAVSACIGGTGVEDLQNWSNGFAPAEQQTSGQFDLSGFTIPDQDFNWVDMDDFVEIDWILPSESNPRTRILPLAYSPRFSYFRRTDHEDIGPHTPGYSPFGNEPTHHCVMSQDKDNDPRRVQRDLVKERLETIETQISSHKNAVGEQELHIVREGHTDEGTPSEYDLFLKQGESLKRRKKFLKAGLRRLEKLLSESNTPDASPSEEPSPQSEDSPQFEPPEDDPEIDSIYASSSDEFVSNFDNRFIIHNIQLKWNNSLRDIILRYVHQVNQRRGFVYYMSRRAIKFMQDIVEEQRKTKFQSNDKARQTSTHSMYTEDVKGSEEDDESSVQDRIEQLLHDAKKFVNADDTASRRTGKSDTGSRNRNRTEEIASEFTPQNSYHIRLIAPQIQLQSEKNKRSVALLTAKGMQLKVVSIMDKNRVYDDVSGLVQRQYTLDMDSAQFFVAAQKTFASHLHIYCGNRYGNPRGVSWPPWVSLESMFDFNLDTPGFVRIIRKTSASLRYDKFNTLRLKYNEKIAAPGGGGDGNDENPHSQVANESRIDQVSVDFPHVRAVCDSSQYYSMYIIVLDLLMYSEPLEQVRREKLEKIMLATDFGDLRGAPEMVACLQQRIRHLEEIKRVFQIQAGQLDTQACKDRMSLERDLATCEDELFFIMKAITTSQRKNEERAKSLSSSFMRWSLSASEVVWHLLKDHNQTFVEFQLRNAAYERTDNIDGSNHNTIEVQHISGLNLLPNALYPEMIAPYLDDQRPSQQNEYDNMLRVDWYMLEAISGIPVVNNFEVSLFPLKVQLERELGMKLFEYIFPGVGSNAFEGGNFSPFIIKHMPREHDSESDKNESPQSPATDAGKGATNERVASSDILGSRLKPTFGLPDKRKPDSSSRRTNTLNLMPIDKEASQRMFRRHGGKASISSAPPLSKKKNSAESLHFLSRQHSDSTAASQPSSDAGNEEKQRSFSLSRNRAAQKTDKPSDDLSQMMSRASNYMILTHVKVNDVVLCLSYKGKGDRNLEDIHDFVFRLPVLEYRNKSWSNLDLALRLKKDAMKALISHAPAIVGNKFSHRRPSKQHQKRLRELASGSQTSNTPELSIFTRHRHVISSDSASSPASRDSVKSESPLPSLNSTASALSRTRSHASSLHPAARPNARPSTSYSSHENETGEARRGSASLSVPNGDGPSDSPQTDSSYGNSERHRKRLSLGRKFFR